MHTIWRTEQRQRRRRVVLTTVLVALAVVVAAYLLGVGALQCLLLATAVTTVGATFLAVDQLDDDPALPPLLDSGDRSGTRRDVSRLSWVLAGYDNRVGRLPYLRIRAIAANRLAWRGIDLATAEGHEAARQFLGPQGYATLVDDAPEAPTERVFVSCVALLETLDGSSAPDLGPALPGSHRGVTSTSTGGRR